MALMCAAVETAEAAEKRDRVIARARAFGFVVGAGLGQGHGGGGEAIPRGLSDCVLVCGRGGG
ncbi:MAG: hypothetical protein U9Q37_11285 [Euryarchaeota archaeon]|nr:hypothetical protein [Euryarchaeota archaeon]